MQPTNGHAASGPPFAVAGENPQCTTAGLLFQGEFTVDNTLENKPISIGKPSIWRIRKNTEIFG
ncbi:hypothetical protein LF95_18760 [Thalassospira sp. TSL5-1]|nr:hypothetical protein LF95_18760 [Thalassospira sp. TSL5-1]